MDSSRLHLMVQSAEKKAIIKNLNTNVIRWYLIQLRWPRNHQHANPSIEIVRTSLPSTVPSSRGQICTTCPLYKAINGIPNPRSATTKEYINSAVINVRIQFSPYTFKNQGIEAQLNKNSARTFIALYAYCCNRVTKNWKLGYKSWGT